MNEMAWIWMLSVQSVVTLITLYLIWRVLRNRKNGHGEG